uniref:Uncharacterized protein n=1 Tax=Fundulus heteroclitus TaxID=8078 RepID=A0A3Q2SWS5_FUNHE
MQQLDISVSLTGLFQSCSQLTCITGNRRRKPAGSARVSGGGRPGLASSSSSESGEDADEEDHADEGEGDQDEHQPQQPVDGLLGASAANQDSTGKNVSLKVLKTEQSASIVQRVVVF